MAKVYEYILSATDKISPVLKKVGKGLGTAYMGVTMFSQSAMAVNQTAELFERNAQAIEQMVEPGKEFESSMADLSSITGIAGQKLKDLGKTARIVGKDSGLGASGAVEAYKLLASQIDVSKIGIVGLNNLQSKTITLAQASGMHLGDSANSLAGTINQFGLAADQAGRVINVLAAGSKFGAAEIPELAQSFKVAGASASAAGLSVESTAGAIEALSKMNLKGAEAGTALRNILLKMQTTLGVDFKVTKLSDALAALTPKMGDAAFMAKTFGAENIAAAQFLAKNAELVEEMTQRVTGTNTAYEQAAIRTNTFAHRMDVMQAKMKDMGISFFNATKPMLPYMQQLATMSSVVVQFTPILGSLGKGFTWVSGTILKTTTVTNAAGVATKKYVIVQKAQVAWQKISAAATWIYNNATLFTGVVLGILKNKINKVRNAMLQGSLSSMLMSGAMSVAAAAAGVLSIALKGIGKAIYSIPVVGWIAAAVAALIGLFTLLWNRSEKFRGFLGGLWGATKAIFHNIGVFFGIVYNSMIKPVFDWMGGKITWLKETVLAPLGGFFTNVWNGIVSGLQWFGGIFSGIWNWVTTVLQKVGLRFTSFWDFVGSAFKLGAKLMFWPFTLLMKIFPNLAGWLEEKVWQPIKAMFDKILGRVQKLVEPIKKIWSKLFKNEKYEDVGDAWNKGRDKAIDKWRKEKEAKQTNKVSDLGLDKMPEAQTPKYKLNPIDLGLDDGSGKKTKGEKTGRNGSSGTGSGGGNSYSEWLDRNNKKESSAYTAITSKLDKPTKAKGDVTNIDNSQDRSKKWDTVTNTATKTTVQNSSVVQTIQKKEQPATILEVVNGIGKTLGKVAASVAFLASLNMATPAQAVENHNQTIENKIVQLKPDDVKPKDKPGPRVGAAPVVNITIQNITIQNTGSVDGMSSILADEVVKVLKDNLPGEILKLLS